MKKALSSIGAKPELFAEIDRADTLDAPMLYQAAERLGADRFLLAIIGSRGDTMSDDEVLDALLDWNAGRSFFDQLIASVDPPGPWRRPPLPRRRR